MLSRADLDGRKEDGQRSTGVEARGSRSGSALAGKLAELESAAARAEVLAKEIGGLEAELERLRGSQQAREKDRLTLEHEMRKLAEDTNRANSRLSVARLELERLRVDREKSVEQRAASQTALEQRESLRASEESRWTRSGWSWKDSRPQWRRCPRNIRSCARNWRGWRSGLVESGRR